VLYVSLFNLLQRIKFKTQIGAWLILFQFFLLLGLEVLLLLDHLKEAVTLHSLKQLSVFEHAESLFNQLLLVLSLVEVYSVDRLTPRICATVYSTFRSTGVASTCDCRLKSSSRKRLVELKL
jgi:hypothetical protein